MTISVPSGVVATPSTLDFTSCGNTAARTVVFSSSVAGTAARAPSRTTTTARGADRCRPTTTSLGRRSRSRPTTGTGTRRPTRSTPRRFNGNPDVQGLAINGTNNCAPTLSFSVTDPGSADTHSGTIGWGDGSLLTAFSGESYSGSHAYSSAGNYLIAVDVADDDGETDHATLASGYTVYNIPSTILQPINYTGPRSLFKLG